MNSAAAATPAAASTFSGQPLSFPRWTSPGQGGLGRAGTAHRPGARHRRRATATTLLAPLVKGARSPGVAGAGTLGRQRAGRPERPGHVGEPRPAGPGGPPAARPHHRQSRATEHDSREDARRRPSGRRPRGRARLEPAEHPGQPPGRAAAPSAPSPAGCSRRR